MTDTERARVVEAVLAVTLVIKHLESAAGSEEALDKAMDAAYRALILLRSVDAVA